MDDPAFLFTGSWLSDQQRTVEPNALGNAQRVDLRGLRFGRLTLGLQVQKSTPAPDPIPVLRYTVAAARREWLRSLTASGPRRLGFSGSFDGGALGGLAFDFARQSSDKGAFADNHLHYARGGFEADLRMRDAGRDFTRSSLMNEEEWKAVKDLVGWKQTDLAFQWQGLPGLSIATTMTRGRKAGSDEVRRHDRLELGWKPSAGTDFRFYDDRSAVGANGSVRSGTRGFSLSQTVSGLSLRIAQDEVDNIKGQTGRTRQMAFSTRDDGNAVFAANLTDARINGGHTAVQRFSVSTRKQAPNVLALTRIQTRNNGRASVQDILDLRAKPARNMDLAANYTQGGGEAGTRHDARLSLTWKPDKEWQVDGSLQQRTGAPQTLADIRLSGAPDARTRIEAHMQRLDDPKNPNTRQDTLHVERTLARDARLTVDYDRLALRAGASGDVTRLGLDAKTPLGHLVATHRIGQTGILPDETEMLYNGAFDGGRLTLNANWKRTGGVALSESGNIAWKLKKGLTLTANVARNPPDKKGQPQKLTTRNLGAEVRLDDGLTLGLCYVTEDRPSFTSRRADLTLKGRLDRNTQVDLGLTTRRATGLPAHPAYNLTIRREINADHRFLLDVQQKTRAVQGADDLSARLELVSDF